MPRNSHAIDGVRRDLSAARSGARAATDSMLLGPRRSSGRRRVRRRPEHVLNRRALAVKLP
jgi:hypothetical protein